MRYGEFLKRASASGLVTRADMLRLREDLAEVGKRPTTDSERYTLIRNYLIAKGILTEWHCEVLESRVNFCHFIGEYKVLEYISADEDTFHFVAEDMRSHERVQIAITRGAAVFPFVVTRDAEIIERGNLTDFALIGDALVRHKE